VSGSSLLPPRLAAVPVVLLSGEDEAPEHAAALEVTGVLKKPFEAEKLLDAVRRAIGRSRQSPSRSNSDLTVA
jgi:DNA-binding response OmpR family regulator